MQSQEEAYKENQNRKQVESDNHNYGDGRKKKSYPKNPDWQKSIMRLTNKKIA